MRDRPGSVMLFAAGFGTRMRDLTKTRPKPLIDVGGKALIDHALDQVRAYGPDKIVANLHYLPDQIEGHLKGQGILFSHETTEILETGGGLRVALPMLGPGPVFTMNTDAVWQGPNPLDILASNWNPDNMDALLLCVSPAQALGHRGKGDFLRVRGTIAARGPGAIYTGVQILKTDLLEAMPERVFSLNTVWDKMLLKGRLHVADYPGRWCDVGQPESIALAETLLEGGDV